MEITSGDRKLTKRLLTQQIQDGTVSIDLSFPQEANLDQGAVRRLLALYKAFVQYAPQENCANLKGNITFHLKQLQSFDLSFLAVLSLFKNRIAPLSIILHFTTTGAVDSPPKQLFQLGHFMATSMPNRESTLFRLKHNRTWIEFTEHNLDSYLTSSTEYLPLLRIDEYEYQNYFINTFEAFWRDVFETAIAGEDIENFLSAKLSDSKSFRESLYQTCRQFIVSNASKKLMTNAELHFDRISCVLSFLHAMRRLAAIHVLLREYIDRFEAERIKKNLMGDYGLGIKGFTRDDNVYYQTELMKRIRGIFRREPYFVLLFSLFVDNVFEFSVSAKNEVKSVLDRVDAMLSFSAQLFDGIKELVKNVTEHATSKHGVLSVRLFTPYHLRKLKGEPFFDYLDARSQTKNFVDVVLLDDSKSGMLEQTLSKLSTMAKEFLDPPENGLIEKDMKQIKEGKMTLKDFFVLGKSPLLHQEIRSAASLGLLIFSDFLVKNDGITYVSTIDGNSIFSATISRDAQQNLPGGEGMPFGTYYDILIPVTFGKPLRSVPIYSPYETTAAMDAYEELAKMTVIQSQEDMDHCMEICSAGRRCLMIVDLQAEPRGSATLSFGKLDYARCADCSKQVQSVIALRLVDNLAGADPSSVFRVLAQVQYRFGCKSVIVYNLHEGSLQRLLGILRIYEKITGRAWSKDQFALFYYLPDDKDNYSRAYHVWIIGGDRFSDAIYLNSKLLLTNHGRMLIDPDENSRVPNPDFIQGYHNNPLFSASGHLLPLDLLLREGGYSLFEWNVMRELGRPILED